MSEKTHNLLEQLLDNTLPKKMDIFDQLMLVEFDDMDLAELIKLLDTPKKFDKYLVLEILGKHISEQSKDYLHLAIENEDPVAIYILIKSFARFPKHQIILESLISIFQEKEFKKIKKPQNAVFLNHLGFYFF